MATDRKRTVKTTLAELLQGIAEVAEQVEITGVALDSRKVVPGSLFIALNGIQSRGHDFIDGAVAAGAVAVVYDASVSLSRADLGVPVISMADLAHKAGLIAERFYGVPSASMWMVGVTGTNGKTSCSRFLAQAFDCDTEPCGVIGTMGNGMWGDQRDATHTTPDAVTLHGLLAGMRDQGARRVAMEVSSHALDQGRVAAVDFDVALFTNLSHEHLDYHGSMEAYGEAKARLFALPSVKWAVINADDDFGRCLLNELKAGINAVAYSLSEQVELPPHARHVRATVESLNQDGMVLMIRSSWGKGRLHSNLLGRFNAENLLAVLGVLLSSGVSFDDALARMARLNTVAGRMEPFGGSENTALVVVDYAHTPDALEQVLKNLREHCSGRLWCLFGCGGERDKAKRPLMGEIAERYADQVLLTDDNPRNENADEIIEAIISGMKSPAEVIVERDRYLAIARAIQSAAANDVVLVAGKGHEDYQIVGDQKRSFSDRATVRELLGAAA